MTKRRFALPLIIAAVMIAAGCGYGITPTAQPTSTPAVTSQAPTASPTPQPTPEPTPEPTARPSVKVRGMLPGAAPKDMDAVLTELNTRLAGTLAVELQLQWAAADKYDKAVATAMASGAKPDFLWCAPSNLAGYAQKGYIAQLDDLLATYGADITKNINADIINTMKVGGKLMGIPSSGGMEMKSLGQALIYREDLRLQYNLPKPDSVTNMEQYFAGIAQNAPDMIPFCSKTAALAAFWLSGASDMLPGADGIVAYTVDAGGAVTCSALQAAEPFKQAVMKAREWYTAGYIPKSVLAEKDAAAAVADGRAAASTGSVQAVPALQAALAAKTPGAVLSVLPLTGCGAGMIAGNGGNALCVAKASAAPDRTMELINWFYASQENHDLICYGIENRNYSSDGDKIVKQGSGYDGFPSAIFDNAAYIRYPSGTPDDVIAAVKAWNDGASVSPLAGFALNPAPVKDAAAKAKTVYANYGALLLSGCGDAETILNEYGAKMTAAGQEKVVAEAQKQVDAFIASKQ